MNKALFNVLLFLGAGYALNKLLKKRKTNKNMIVKGFYQVPENIPNRIDALHSFESRKIDGFGGKMSTQINAALRELYKKGMNPDLLNLDIQIDPVKYSVTWSALLGESKNKIAYVGMITRGSAGGGADERAKMQVQNIKSLVPNGTNITLIKDLNFTNKIKIRQFFYKYGLTNYPAQ
jgi:hypothetical protein